MALQARFDKLSTADLIAMQKIADKIYEKTLSNKYRDFSERLEREVRRRMSELMDLME
jgi:hypothetical protein